MKISQLKMVIREVVREEIQLGLKEVINELKQPTQIITGAIGEVTRNTKPLKPKKQNFSKNPVLNEMLNETATNGWETMGGTQYTSERMGELVGGAYGDLMNNNPEAPVIVDGQQPDFLKKDYRAIMKAVDKKQGK